MKKAVLIRPSVDVIQFLGDTLLENKEHLSRNLIVFPGKRPAHFLRKHLADILESPFESPRFLSMDEFIDFACESLHTGGRKINAIDATAIIFDLHKKSELIGAMGENLSIDSFLPWGFKFFSDFEEMRIELTAPSKLKEIESIAGEELPANVRRKLTSLSTLYESFYNYLAKNRLCTRASRYTSVAESIERVDLSSFENAVFVGFYALTKAEQQILNSLKTRDNVSFVFQEGPGIETILSTLSVSAETIGHEESEPRIQFYPAMDAHGEVFALNEVIRQKKDFCHKDVVVLPSAETLFPVIQHTVPYAESDYNISMGYPLFRTPIYSLTEALGRALETRSDSDYFVPDYLGLVLHPYVKNVYFEKASYRARIVFHTIEEHLAATNRRFLKLEEIEEDETVIQECNMRLGEEGEAEADGEKIKEYLRNIHGILIKPFQDIKNVEDFGEKLLSLVSFISRNSPAKLHPYAIPFMKRMIEGIHELASSGIRNEQFSETRSYFRLLRSYFRTISCPFEGTPVKGLQVLGFLETRNIKFDTVHVLDVNEGVLPNTRKEETLLPHLARKHLGLPTHREREKISRYHFERLVRAAHDVHVFYVEGADKEKSRLVEKLMWDQQKKAGNPELPHCKEVFFKVKFSQKEPEPVTKTGDMIEHLENLVFSATKIDSYLHCPLRFHHKYILGLSRKQEIRENVEQDEIGGIVHNILKVFFGLKKHGKLTLEDKDCDVMDRIVEDVFRDRYSGFVEGDTYLIKLQIKRRMKDIIDFHRVNHQGISIEECESWHTAELELSGERKVSLGGRFDRLDRRDQQVCIVDYKTSTTAKMPNLKKLQDSSREEWYKTVYSVQLPLYVLLYTESHKEVSVNNVNSSLMILGAKRIEEKMLFGQGIEPEAVYGVYKGVIRTLLEEILDGKRQFEPTRDIERECVWCDYKDMCGTQWVKRKSM
jgi:hypothetical protein